MKSIHRDLFIVALLITLAWVNTKYSNVDFVIGVIVFYFLFRSILYSVLKGRAEKTKRYLLSKYNIFIIIHSAIFLILLFYIKFDFFRDSGDWFEYDYYGRLFTEFLRNGTPFSVGQLSKAQSYVFLVGAIYYLFSFSTTLAVYINIYFIVTASMILYLIVSRFSSHRIASRAMHLTLLFPLMFALEIALLKECFLMFFFITTCYSSLKLSQKFNIGNFIFVSFGILVLFFTRFIYVIPLVFYLLYRYLFDNIKLYRFLFVIAGMITVFYLTRTYMPVKIADKSIFDYIFQSGISIADEDAGNFNYQILLTNPINLIMILLKHPFYFLKNVFNYYFNIWTYSSVYYVPFVSTNSMAPNNYPLLSMINYFSSFFLWVSFFTSLNGLLILVKRKYRESSIILLTLFLIPLLLSIVGGNKRYMFVLFYFILTCTAYGFELHKRSGFNISAAVLTTIMLILYVNQGTFIFQGLVFALFLGLVVVLYGFRDKIKAELDIKKLRFKTNFIEP